MEVFLECCMTLFFSAAMLLLIVRLAKGEEKNMMFARVFYTAMVFAMPHKKEQIAGQQA